jgi:GTP-binding protein
MHGIEEAMALVAIVGRPNVGKSTLFNRMVRERRALVDNFPGLTRDRHYGRTTWEDQPMTVIDTGGYLTGEGSVVEAETRQQVLFAVDEADLVLFVADAKTGLHPEDEELVDILRRRNKPVLYAVNKIDGPEQQIRMSDFYALGVDPLYPLSASHGFGFSDLMDDLAEALRECTAGETSLGEEVDDEHEPSQPPVRVCVVGRPNVGKSTLVNRLLGEERVIVSPTPGTTRDAVDTPFERGGRRYVLIDTAGIRRKGRTREKIEKLGIVKALQAIDRSHVAILLIDAEEGITDQDLHVGGYITERSRGCVIATNKWDLVEQDPRLAKWVKERTQERLRFLSFAPRIDISALTGKRTGRILPTVSEVFDQYNRRMPTSFINRVLEESVEKHAPHLVGGRRLKFYYGTQTAVRPPTFVLFCNYPDKVHFSYERYLTNQFRERFGMEKTPLKMLFRGRGKSMPQGGK